MSSKYQDRIDILFLFSLIDAGFDVKNGLPLWVSYTVDNQSLALDDDVVNSKLVWRYDPRLRIEDLSVCDRLDDDESLNNSNLAVLTSLYPDCKKDLSTPFVPYNTPLNK